MPKENTTKYAILGALSMEPGSGYDVKKFCDKWLSYFWHEDYGNIYPMLRRLAAEGLVTKEARQTPGRPPKIIYRITKKGTNDLGEWLKKPAEYRPARFELLFKIFFAKDIPLSNIKEKLRKERDKNAKELKTFESIEAMLRNEKRYKRELPLWLVTLDYGKRFSKFMIEWCDETIRALRGR